MFRYTANRPLPEGNQMPSPIQDTLVASMPKRARLAHPRAVALVPACNEQDIIELTVRSLMNQSYPFEYVLVIANNCKDRTVEIVEKLQLEFGADRLKLIEMKRNDDMKAGALNYGFATVDPSIEFVFGMDSDTIVEAHLLEEALKKFTREPMTGGICSAYRTLPLSVIRPALNGEVPAWPNPSRKKQKTSASLWEKFLWRLQNIEFGLANAWRIEHYKSARVLPGVSSLYRMEALRQTAERQLIRRVLGALAKQNADDLQQHQLLYGNRMQRLAAKRSKTPRRIAKTVLRTLPELVRGKYRKTFLGFDRLLLKGVISPEVAAFFANGRLQKLSPADVRRMVPRIPKDFDRIDNLYEVWRVKDQVEDYTLTLDLKDNGWDVKSYHDMVSWSDVPLSLKAIWNQRQRWYSGTIDTIRSRGLRKHSRYELFTVGTVVLSLLARVTLLLGYTTLVVLSTQIQWVSPFLGVILLAVFVTWQRLHQYGEQLDFWQRLIAYTIIVNEGYNIYRDVIYVYGIYLSYFRPKRGW